MYYHKSTENVKGYTILIFIVRCTAVFIYEEIVLKQHNNWNKIQFIIRDILINIILFHIGTV